MTTKHLDIGCDSNLRNPFAFDELYGVDIIKQEVSDFIYEQCNVVLEPLPFKESTFNSVSAYDLLEHIPRFAIINNQTTFPFILLMNEIYRVLKPGGRFMCLEFSKIDNETLNFFYKQYSKTIPLIGKYIVGASEPYEYLIKSIDQFYNQNQLMELMNKNGFCNTEFRNLSNGVSAIHSGWKI